VTNKLKRMSTESTKTAVIVIKTTTKEPRDLNARLSKFAWLIKELMEKVPLLPENVTMLAQLSKNVGYIIADHNIDLRIRKKNRERKADILLRHLRETDCWLRFINRNNTAFNFSDLYNLIRECVELKNTLASIAQK
jgi:hypothetical protein